jgi:FkbM family methyltransferase
MRRATNALAERPYYLFRPDQLVRRVVSRRRTRTEAESTAVTAWGMPLRVAPRDLVGDALLRAGVIEMPITEAMWRLTEPADLAVDVGANVGYFTALQARRAEEVVALEPHPEIALRLQSSIDAWRSGKWQREALRVRLVPKAASDRLGTARLSMPADHELNEARATIAEPANGKFVDVETITLDALFPNRTVGVLKVDVEGHELNVFRGADRLLNQGRVRDLFFEEHDPFPTVASEFLSDRGYTLFGLEQHIRGVRLISPGSSFPRWHAPTYLATNRPQRARDLMERLGWHSLRPPSRTQWWRV